MQNKELIHYDVNNITVLNVDFLKPTNYPFSIFIKQNTSDILNFKFNTSVLTQQHCNLQNVLNYNSKNSKVIDFWRTRSWKYYFKQHHKITLPKGFMLHSLRASK